VKTRGSAHDAAVHAYAIVQGGFRIEADAPGRKAR